MRSDRLRRGVARLLIAPLDLFSRVMQRLRGNKFGIKHHYHLMKIFRALADPFWVEAAYPNPLRPGKKMRLRLNLCENTQQWLFRSKGFYERDWIRWLAIGLETSDCFIDVGAHVGVFTLALAQAFPHKTVKAVEPLPSNYQLLLANIQRNGLKNVIPFPAAVAREKGPVPFYVNPINEGGGSLRPLATYRTGGIALDAAAYQKRHIHFQPCLEVSGMPLDTLIDNQSILKIDVEGTELDVLASAAASLDRGLVEMAVVEVEPAVAKAVLQWFAGRYFDCFVPGRRDPLRGEEEVGPKVSFGGHMYIALRRGTSLYKRIQAAI